MSARPALDFIPHLDTIVTALRGDGWLVLPQFLPALWCDALLADCQTRREEFAIAAVGRGNQRQHLSDQRRDATLWLGDDVAVQRDYLAAMDNLRSEINRQLFLGLRDYEAHYAHYAPGAFYRRHYDAFAHTSPNGSLVFNSSLTSNHSNMPRRVLTTVVYLNTSAGGELVIGDDEREIARVAPVAGTAVFFMSAEFPHEVLPAQSDRYSISGWFRT